MSTLIKLRRDTAANWTAANPVLALGEAGIVTDTLTWKVGDGITVWNDLPFMASGGAANIGNWVFDGNNATVDNDGYPHLYGGPDGGPEFTYLEEAGNTGSYSQTMYINGEDGFFVSLDYGNAQFAFNTNGTTKFPTLTVDLHNGGNQSGQVLQFGDAGQQAIITGPTPAANINAQRLIIQGQRGNGTGEGGDVYVWAGDAETNGGDIKIYAGDADNVSAGGGGYVNIAGGDGFNYGGDITLSGGYSANGYGGQISLNGGQGQTDGGLFSINGGYGTTGQGGAVQITGGISGNGLSQYGNVGISAGSSTWTFDNTGNLTLPSGTPSINYANGDPFSGAPVNTGNVTFDDNVVIGTGDMRGGSGLYLAPGTDSPGNLQYFRVRGGDYVTHIHLDTGNNAFFDQYFGADAKYVKLEATGNIVINADDYVGNTAQWNFGTDGNLTAPGAINVGNMSIGTVPGDITADANTGVTFNVSGPNGLFAVNYLDEVGNANTSGGELAFSSETGNATYRISLSDDLGDGFATKIWRFDGAGNITLPTGGAIETAPGSNGNILIHPDGNGAVIIQGGASTLLTLSSDLPDTQNKLEIDTYGANLGSQGGGVFVGVYRRTNSATLADDRLAQFGGKGTVDGITPTPGSAGQVAVDAAFNWAPGDTPTHISFWTTAVGQSTPVEVARVGAGQNFTLYAGNLTVGNGRVTSNLVNTVTRTVSALPLPANAGAGSRMFVTDADSRTWGNIVVGGAGNAVPVWCDGTDWYIG